MAAAEILAIGTTGTSSADVAVTTAKLVCLKDAAGPTIASGAYVTIEIKDDAGQYFQIDALTSGNPSRVLTGPGTYRFTRKAGVSCGVFSG